MDSSKPTEYFLKRIREITELSRYMMQYGSREEMIEWGIRPDIVDAIVELRK